MDYSQIFNHYETSEGIRFTLKNRRIHFPDDKTLPIYGKAHIGTNTPWTILSYNIYGTIDYWWLLNDLNDSMVFYANGGSDIWFILPKYLSNVLNAINHAIADA